MFTCYRLDNQFFGKQVTKVIVILFYYCFSTNAEVDLPTNVRYTVTLCTQYTLILVLLYY